MEIVWSERRRAAENLALEQELLAGGGAWMLLYINDPSVVVGRNQTLEAEVDEAYCRREGIEVVRRQSGGGTVYHDGGNVNYALICDGGQRPLDRDYTAPVVWALRRMGVDARTGARGEITVDGLKVSGSASMVRRGRVLFHGTLLFSADLGALDAALRGDAGRRGKGVASVPGRVGNLREMLPRRLSVEQFAESLKAALTEYFSEHPM